MNWLDKLSPQVTTIGSGFWATNFIEPDRYLFDHELVIFSQGKCAVRIEDELLIRPANSWLIVPPNKRHQSVAVEGSTERYWIHFDWIKNELSDNSPICIYAPTKPDTSLIHFPPPFVPIEILHGRLRNDSAVYNLLETMKFRWEKGSENERQTCRALLMEIFIRILFPRENVMMTSSDRNSDLAYKIKQHLDQMPGQETSIREYLEKLDYSYEHLCRLFKQKFGLSPLNYLNNLRLENAKELLQTPGVSISQVAYQVGFNDPGYFTRLFTRYTGVAPRNYNA